MCVCLRAATLVFKPDFNQPNREGNDAVMNLRRIMLNYNDLAKIFVATWNSG